METHVGDLLSVTHGIIVHGCNAKGVMGSGVAVAVKRRYPAAYEAYRKHHERQGLRLGEVITVVVDRKPDGTPQLIIANAITQNDFGSHRVQVDYLAVRECFVEVALLAHEHGLPVHFPLIGCGLAGGNWAIVEPIIRQQMKGLSAHLWVLQ